MINKLIQTDKGLLLLDLEAEINNGCYYLDEINELCKWVSKIFNSTLKTKVIASSYIDELPKISQSIEEIKEMIKDKELSNLAIHYQENISINSFADVNAFFDGYKSNKALYTKEQMIEAMRKAQFIGRQGSSMPDSEYERIIQSIEPKIDCFFIVTDLWVRSEIQYSITKIL